MPKVVIQKNYLTYDIALVCWILYSIIVGATTLPISSMVGNLWYVACIALLLYDFLKLKKIRSNFFLFFSAIGVTALVAAVANICSYPPLLAWVLLVICSSGVERRHIVSVYLKTYVGLCTVIPAMALLGMIPNSVMDTVGNTGTRTAYGFSHPNVFAACVLVLIMCWTYLNWKKVRLIHVIAIDVIGYFLFVLTDSLAGCICVVVMSLLALFERLLDKREKLQIWYRVTIVLLILCPLISYCLMANFSVEDPRMLAIDLFSTGRVRTMNMFYNTYGWRWLGQNLLFDLENRAELLFALDNSYAYMLMKFGLLITLMYYIGLGRVLAMAIKNRDNFLIICIMTFILYGFFENYFFKVQFNFTLLFIALPNLDSSKSRAAIYSMADANNY